MPYYRRYIGGISGSALVKTVPVSLFSLFISLSLPLSRSLFFPSKKKRSTRLFFLFSRTKSILTRVFTSILICVHSHPSASPSRLPLLQLIPPPTYLFSNSPLLQLTSPPTHSSSNLSRLQLTFPSTHFSFNSPLLQLTSSSTHLKRIYDTGIIEYLPVIKMYLRVG